MRLDETIVWRLSYANTPLHVNHTNNNINKNNKKKRTVEQVRRKWTRSPSSYRTQTPKAMKRKEYKKKYSFAEATLLPCTLTLINKHATANHLYHSYRVYSFAVIVQCAIFMSSSSYRFDFLLVCLRTNMWMSTTDFGASLAINVDCFLFFSSVMRSDNFICSFFRIEDAFQLGNISWYLFNFIIIQKISTIFQDHH